eukprot:GHVN01061870.1.p1 GENE.GHVN01061870.1~~GHVN01061870.1.p1  ORF type:complete len:375 (-),score=87.70 GHVN01061870.1:262-1386(-)
MATLSTEQFWHDFIRRPDVDSHNTRLTHQMLLKERATVVKQKRDEEARLISKAVSLCEPHTTLSLTPLLSLDLIHRVLWTLLGDCKVEEGVGEGTDCGLDLFGLKRLFAERPEVCDELIKAGGEILKDPDSERLVRERYKQLLSVSEVDVSKVDCGPRLKTWHDVPSEELAERLSKGEIIGRDDWVPGLSTGRRKLDSHALSSHLEFGERVKEEGNQASKRGDWELALTRYTQGVELLNWVQGDNKDDTLKARDLHALFLRNKAQAALMLERWSEAIKACDVALDIDPDDMKALYRRGMGRLNRGDVVDAKNDFKAIIKSPYNDPTSVTAARYGLQQLRRVVSNWKNDTLVLMEKSASEVREENLIRSQDESVE